MSQNAGLIGKLILLGGSALAMIGRCASKGDDILRVGARGFDDVAVVSDDAFRYGDDVFRNTDNALVTTSKSITDETINYFDDVFLNVATEGADWFLDEDDEGMEIPEKNLISDFQLINHVKWMQLGFSSNKYVFTDETRASFLKILAYSTPIDKPEEVSNKLFLLKGKQVHWMILGKDWVGIKRFDQNDYKYYTLKVDFTKAFK